MIQVLSISGTIFAVIALGWLLVRRGVFDGTALDVLGGYVVTCALPALIFRAVSSRPVAETFDAAYLLALLTTSLTVFAASYWLVRGVFGGSPMAACFGAMGASCANSGFVGYPMMGLAMPQVADHALALNMSFENLVMIPLVLALAEAEKARAAASTARIAPLIARRLATSPVILALFAGLAVAALGLNLPQIVSGPVNILANSSAAVSLLVIGGGLAGLTLRDLGPQAWTITGLKLLAMPALAYALLQACAAFGLTPEPAPLAPALLVMTALPAMTIYPVLARRYGEITTPAAVLLLQTLASFVTLTALLALLGLAG
ncbi:AEC family transporter [Vannielia litorea]|uniref:Permease n=1 Tax=Vannielia litorea TaxID=1217970 RepID=A0A1N6EQP2_9RHOB|nr:AEC family transporter [Vannielia litorea]SIN85409.1 hypothetical protein SAMN05444002_1019 [Vannielia litorea]